MPYDTSEVDFMAAYVIPDDAWFIISIAVTSLVPGDGIEPSRPFRGPGF